VAEKNTSVSNIKAKSVIRVILGHQRSKKGQEIWQEYHESVKIAIRFLFPSWTLSMGDHACNCADVFEL
jgi:hypothetical protein